MKTHKIYFMLTFLLMFIGSFNLVKCAEVTKVDPENQYEELNKLLMIEKKYPIELDAVLIIKQNPFTADDYYSPDNFLYNEKYMWIADTALSRYASKPNVSDIGMNDLLLRMRLLKKINDDHYITYSPASIPAAIVFNPKNYDSNWQLNFTVNFPWKNYLTI